MKSIIRVSKEESLIKSILFLDIKLTKNDFYKINFEKLVFILSSHLMLPAFYYCCKKKNLLVYLPEDLSSYLSEIYNINKERNKKLLVEMKIISKFLDNSGINHLFLKGASLIYQKIYEDLGERMIGDIDILIKRSDRKDVIKLLNLNNYKSSFIYKSWKANVDPNFINNNKLFAIDLHSGLLPFNYSYLMDDKMILNENKETANKFLETKDEILYTIYNYSVSDYAYLRANYSYRKLYDIKKLTKNFKFKEFPKDKFMLDFFMKAKLLGLFKNMKLDLNYYNPIMLYRFLLKKKIKPYFYIDNYICSFYIFIKLLKNRLREIIMNKDYLKSVTDKIFKKNKRNYE